MQAMPMAQMQQIPMITGPLGFDQPQQQLGQPHSITSLGQSPIGVPMQHLQQQQIPQFDFSPASPRMFPDNSQHAPALPTISSIIRETTGVSDLNMLNPTDNASTSHAPAGKTLSAIVREIVNDESIVPPLGSDPMQFDPNAMR